MHISRTYISIYLFSLIISPIIIGCSPLIAKFDNVAYQQTISIKVDALALLDKAGTPYKDNETAINALMSQAKKAQEYAKGIPKNNLTTEQWDIMLSPKHNLLGGVIEKWKKESKLNKSFINNVKVQIEQGFNNIIDLELGKNKPAGDK